MRNTPDLLSEPGDDLVGRWPFITPNKPIRIIQHNRAGTGFNRLRNVISAIATFMATREEHITRRNTPRIQRELCRRRCCTHPVKQLVGAGGGHHHMLSGII
jgi:hypothetical protein